MGRELELLRNAAVFGGLGDRALNLILGCAELKRVPEGEHFFLEGERGDTMYVLLEGHASVYRAARGDDKLVRLLDVGDCFGEMALLDTLPRSASVMALQECTAIEISGAALTVLHDHHLEEFAQFYINIAREISRRLRESDDALFRCAQGDSTPGDALLLRSA